MAEAGGNDALVEQMAKAAHEGMGLGWCSTDGETVHPWEDCEVKQTYLDGTRAALRVVKPLIDPAFVEPCPKHPDTDLRVAVCNACDDERHSDEECDGPELARQVQALEANLAGQLAATEREAETAGKWLRAYQEAFAQKQALEAENQKLADEVMGWVQKYRKSQERLTDLEAEAVSGIERQAAYIHQILDHPGRWRTCGSTSCVEAQALLARLRALLGDAEGGR